MCNDLEVETRQVVKLMAACMDTNGNRKSLGQPIIVANSGTLQLIFAHAATIICTHFT